MCKVLRLEEAVRGAVWLEGSEYEEVRAGRRCPCGTGRAGPHKLPRELLFSK